jgi:hypothetical protein
MYIWDLGEGTGPSVMTCAKKTKRVWHKMGGQKHSRSLKIQFDDGLIIPGLFCANVHQRIVPSFRSNSYFQVQASAIGIETRVIYKVKHKPKRSF